MVNVTKMEFARTFVRPDGVETFVLVCALMSPKRGSGVSVAMVCVPSGKAARAVCATLDLLELQRQVQRIRVGEHGYALAFDRRGRLIAAGSGAMRAAVLSNPDMWPTSVPVLPNHGTYGAATVW